VTGQRIAAGRWRYDGAVDVRVRHETAAESGSAPAGFTDVYERYFADIYRYIAGRLGRNVADH
jgi:hypothetical protein